MNRKYLLLAALASAMTVSAQDVYEIENLTTFDLNGTARFVGMGGAMSALGADLSTMSSNPAGMAARNLFRPFIRPGAFFAPQKPLRAGDR